MNQLLSRPEQYLAIIFWFIIIVFLLKRYRKEYHSNWNTLIDDFDFSTEEFYKLLKAEIENKGIEHIRYKWVNLSTGTPFGYKRKYLRIDWGDYQYYACCMPIGKGFFISWWLMTKNGFGKILLSKIPFIGGFLVKKLFPNTFYKVDSASAFMTYLQSCVTKVIEDITKDTGLKLNLENQKPILNDIFRR